MTTEIQKTINQTTNIMAPMAAAAGMGYLCARVFLAINPVHAAVFSAAAALVSRIIAPIFEEKFGGWAANDVSRSTGRILGIGTSIAISTVVSTMLGFPFTFKDGVALTGTIFGVTISTAVLVDLLRRKNIA